MVIVRDRWEEELSHCSMDIEFQFYSMKRIMEMDSGDTCTTLFNVVLFNTTELCTYKW